MAQFFFEDDSTGRVYTAEKGAQIWGKNPNDIALLTVEHMKMMFAIAPYTVPQGCSGPQCPACNSITLREYREGDLFNAQVLEKALAGPGIFAQAQGYKTLGSVSHAKEYDPDPLPHHPPEKKRSPGKKALKTQEKATLDALIGEGEIISPITFRGLYDKATLMLARTELEGDELAGVMETTLTQLVLDSGKAVKYRMIRNYALEFARG